MAFENELKERLLAWLDHQVEVRASAILDGSAHDLATYKERCGYIQALRDVSNAIIQIQREINS